MITEIVNGELKQVFGWQYGGGVFFKGYAPVRLGAGYRKKIDVAKTKAALSTDQYAKVFAIALEKKKDSLKKGVSQEALSQEIIDALTPMLRANLESADPAKAELAVLECLLVRAEGSMTVSDWYLHFAEQSEVAEVINFSEGLVKSKTETARSVPISGKGAKEKRAAANSRTTSPPPLRG